MTENKFLDDSIALNTQIIQDKIFILLSCLHDKNVEKYKNTSKDHKITINAYLAIQTQIEKLDSLFERAMEHSKEITFKEYPDQ